MAHLCRLEGSGSNPCRDVVQATHLKFISILVILIFSGVGILSPVIMARVFKASPSYDKTVLLIKCFAAGVILSTSLVHVLPDAFDALNDCHVSSLHPWKDFPFAGLVTLIGSLLALFVDITASSHVHATPSIHKSYAPLEEGSISDECHREMGILMQEGSGEDSMKLKQRLISQVLEIGILFHSVIIGVTMGMSQNHCTIKPLIAALAFHQIFEGMGLGGCIAQAGFSFKTTVYMSFMFSVTTPFGIVLGMIVFALTGYDDSSTNALISEGILGSISSGILIYMALVDLIAVDFFHNKMMDSNQRLKKACCFALVLGSTFMSILAIWA